MIGKSPILNNQCDYAKCLRKTYLDFIKSDKKINLWTNKNFL